MPGYSDLKNLTSMGGTATGIYEQEDSIYMKREKSEEQKLFEINDSIRGLLQTLEDSQLLTEQDNENKA